MEVREVPIDEVIPCRKCTHDIHVIASLARSILVEGLREPIRVWRSRDSFRILDGEKRWRACKSLGMKTIRAAVVDVETEVP